MELARRKTGALFRAAAELGAIAADADAYTVEVFGTYAERVGVAFQIRDDVLDATADSEKLGKPAGQDAEMERPSFVEVTDLSPEEANERPAPSPTRRWSRCRLSTRPTPRRWSISGIWRSSW